MLSRYRLVHLLAVILLATTWNAVAKTGFAQETIEESRADPSHSNGSLVERAELSGDWLGARSTLANHGIAFDISSTQFYQGVASGGLEQAFQFGGRNDYFVNLDGRMFGLDDASSLTLHGETRYGESVSSLAGALLAPNLLLTVPSPNGSVTALTGVTFTHMLSENLQIYFGKFNTLDDFGQPLTGAGSLSGFQNTAMLYNPVYARTIPYSTFGAGFSLLENEETLFSVIVYDTNDTPTISGFETFFDNGASIYAEYILPTMFLDLPGHQGISGTYSTGTYTSLTPTVYLDPIEGLVVVPAQITGSWCLAYNFDQALYSSPDDPEKMWGVFGNLGIADNNPSPVRWFVNGGFSGTSPLAGRESDTFGVAYFYMRVSESLRNLAPSLLPLRDEHGLELYYNATITPWCQLTPDLQVLTPFRERADPCVLVGLRAMINF